MIVVGNVPVHGGRARKLALFASCVVSLGLVGPAVAAGSPGEAVAGTYDILICAAACSFVRQQDVVVKGRVVLFADTLERADLQRFDENRFLHHPGECC